MKGIDYKCQNNHVLPVCSNGKLSDPLVYKVCQQNEMLPVEWADIPRRAALAGVSRQGNHPWL